MDRVCPKSAPALGRTLFMTGQVAKLTGVASRTVTGWFDSGRLKGYRVPGSQDRRIPLASLLKFLREHGMDDAFARVRPTLILAGVPETLAVHLRRSLGGVECLNACTLFNLGFCLSAERVNVVVLLDASLGRGACLEVARLTSGARLASVVALPADDETAPHDWTDAGCAAVVRASAGPELVAGHVRKALGV